MENERLWIYFVGLDEPLEFSGAIAKMHYQLLKSRSVVYRPEPVTREGR